MDRIISISIICIPVLFGAGMLVSCENSMEDIEALHAQSDQPLMTSYDCAINFSDGGDPMVRITGPRMDQYIRNGQTEVVMTDGLEAVFYDSVMEVSSTLRADYGVFHETTRRMDVERNVIIFNPAGDTLRTEALTWFMDSTNGKSRDRAIYTSEKVYIYKDGTDLTGNHGLYSRTDFSKYTLLNLYGELILPEEEEAANSSNDAQNP